MQDYVHDIKRAFVATGRKFVQHSKIQIISHYGTEKNTSLPSCMCHSLCIGPWEIIPASVFMCDDDSVTQSCSRWTHTHTLTHISCLSPSVLCYASPSVMAAFERHCCITRVFCSILVQCFLSWCCPQEALLHNHRSPSEVFAVRQTQVMFLATHSAHITSAHTYESRFI